MADLREWAAWLELREDAYMTQARWLARTCLWGAYSCVVALVAGLILLHWEIVF